MSRPGRRRGTLNGPAPSQAPIEGEVWRPVPIDYYAPVYEVSSEGRVRRSDSGRIRRLVWSGHGTWTYRYVSMSYFDVHHSYRVATLVAGAFLGAKLTPDLEVNHKNGNRGDNRAVNLEWVTRQANNEHAKVHGLHPRGERHGSSKLTEGQVREIRSAKGTDKEIGDRYGVASTTILNIRHRTTWRHVT